MKTTTQYINLKLKGFLEIADGYKLPTNIGSFGEIMLSDGVGGVSWQPPSSLLLTTDDITEAANLYFTNERVDDRVSSLIQNGTGITWTYNDPLNTLTGNVSLSSFNTGNLAEGINLYFTNERVDDRVAALIQNGTGITWTYNDPLNTLTGNISLAPFTTDNLAEGVTNKYFTNEAIDDRVAALIQNGTGITWTYNDPSNTFTGNVSLTPFTTTNLTEGTNLYFTNERVDDRVAALIQNSSSITWTYNDGLNTLTAVAAPSPINVEKNGVLISTRNTVNLIEGTGIVLSIADNGGSNRTDINISSNIIPGENAIGDILLNGLQIGDGDIEHLDFSDKFTVVEGPDQYISLDISMNIGELADVSLSSPITNGEALLYNSISGMWENSIFPDKLINLSDVIITAPNLGDVLVYAGAGTWANAAFSNLPTLQDAYNNSTVTEILTDATRGALTLRRGSALDADNVFDILNGAGAQTFSITGSGIINAGTWNGNIIPISKGGTGQSNAQQAINALTQVASATNEYILTKDTATGNAMWKISTAGSPALNIVLGVGNNASAGQNIILHAAGKYIINDDLAGPSTSNIEIGINATEALIRTTGVAGASRNLVIKSNATGGVILDSPGFLSGPHFKVRSGSTVLDYKSLATTSRTYLLQDRNGTISYIDQIGGNDVDALIVSPTVAQDGYAVSWNNSSNKYELMPVPTVSITGSGTTNEVTFWTSPSNISSDAGFTFNSGTQTLTVPNLIVNGTTTTINSTTVTIDDPIFTIGGDTSPLFDDNKDRGIEFRWYDGSEKSGFFGFDDSTGRFTFIPDSINTSEVFSGALGDIEIGTAYISGINLSTGSGLGKFLKSDGSGNGSWDYIDISDILGIDLITNPPVDGDVLTYGGSPGEWAPKRPRRTWTWSASFASPNVTDSYLRAGGDTYTNLTTFRAAFACKITAISVSTNGSETWTGEIRKNGSPTVITSQSVIASDGGYTDGLSVSINAGDRIEFYCNGTNIDRPFITIWLDEE